MKKDWNDVFFEMVVGRTLQLLEGSISVEEPIEITGKRPDFISTFADGSITVEATAIKTNMTLTEQVSQNESLVQIVSGLIPPDCSIAIWRLPKLSATDSKRFFKVEVSRLLADAIEQARNTGLEVEVEEDFDTGEFAITLYPRRLSPTGIVTHGMSTGFDDTEYHIPRAFQRKKKQVRKSDLPVILALTTSPMGGGLDDFDRALFGHSFERLGYNFETVEVGFEADGVFAQRRTEPPTYAAALIYPVIGFQNIPDPVLYLNSRFSGDLPAKLMKLRTHYLDDKVGGVVVREAQITQLLDSMEFVSNNG